MGVRHRFAQLLDEAPDEARAIEFEGVWRSWGSLRSEARGLNAILESCGLGAGARVGVILENRPEHLGVLLALVASNRCVVTLSPLQPAARLAADIRRSQVPMVVATADLLARDGVLAAIEDLGVAVELSADGAARVVGGEIRTASTVNPGCVIEMLTSGTTGPPKRIELADHQFDEGVGSIVAVPKHGLIRSGVTVVVAPLVHIGGFWGALAPMYAGRGVCLLPRFTVAGWTDAIRRHRPPASSIVPAAVRAVYEADVPVEDLSSLQVITCGTAYCPPDLADAFLAKYGIRVLMTYGATEFAGVIAVWTNEMHKKWWHDKRGSAGRATPGVELRVTDAERRELSVGESGVLEVRSAQTPLGADTWLRTSDLARIDADGFLYVLGRADDVIIRGGFKVSPSSIVSVLERHPWVSEAAVAPLPDDRLGHVPVAGVQVAAGCPAPSVAELVVLCREALTPYEVPAHIVVVGELPRTPSAKVSRVDLLELVVADRADLEAMQ